MWNIHPQIIKHALKDIKYTSKDMKMHHYIIKHYITRY